jgi:hypothetical protein
MTAVLLSLALAHGRPALPPPPVVVAPAPPPVVVPVERPPTVEEFAKAFVPVPGRHQVVLLHPKTCKPVEVCFELPPCGKPPKVNVNKHHLEYDFGKQEVDIRFRHNGTVDVKYRG